MKTAAPTTFPERVGRTLGRLWRGSVRLEQRATQGLVAKGWKPHMARAVLLVVKLVALGVLLYIAFWLALLLLFAIAAAWAAHNTDWDEEQETEWKTGAAGFGLYRGDVRIDAGDPNEDS
jgi:hypothetical protein